MTRLLCWILGHRWKYFPQWITGEPESIRECLRCRVIEQRFRQYSIRGELLGEWWTRTGRRPEIMRVTKRRER